MSEGVTYTKEELRAIRRAWLVLADMADRTSGEARAMLTEAIKLERRERSSIEVARALVVRTAREDWNARAVGIFALAPGLRLAALAAAELRRILHRPAGASPSWRRWLKLSRLAVEAHDTAVSRRLDSIR